MEEGEGLPLPMELVRRILAGIPFPYIPPLRRVCKQWRVAVDGLGRMEDDSPEQVCIFSTINVCDDVMNPMTGALKRLPKTVSQEKFLLSYDFSHSFVLGSLSVSLWVSDEDGSNYRGLQPGKGRMGVLAFQVVAEGGSDDAGSVYGRLDPFMYRSKLMAAGIVIVGKHVGGVAFARPCFAPKWMVIVEAADEEADEQQLEWTIDVEPHHLLPCKRANNMLFLHLLDRPVAFNLDTRAWHLHVPRWNVNRKESVWNVAYVPSLTATPNNDG
ncbi:hypothetical protein SELMODRAFT_421554 [Selaginella moellendorffii]|uniref:F-box domain-containing protein n=1 Tax=Selaginella moellendorffii TaxID=88036 RepID=D8SFM5_SELML|nr:hypothetical protein SELMODRAFT_421554 [Selaginella moellendorffii]